MNDEQFVDALGRSLDEHGRSVDARPDPDGLIARIDRRRNGQRRWFLPALVVIVAFGVIGGYLVGYDGESGPSVTVGGFAARDGGSDPQTPTVVRVVDGDDPGEAVVLDGQLRKLFTRATTDKIEIRAYVDDDAPKGCTPLSGTCPPPECTRQGVVVVELSNEAAVSLRSVWWYPDAPTSFVAGNGQFGEREGAATSWYVVQIGADAPTAVAARGVFADGSDEMDVVDGTAVLAHASTAPIESIEILDDEGNLLGTLDPSESGAGVLIASPKCAAGPVTTVPPPVLQTSPPHESDEATRAAVVQAFKDAWTGSNSQEVRDAATDAADELREWARHTQTKFLTPEEVAGRTVTISSVTIVDSTHASVVYTNTTNGRTLLANRTGHAVYVDGRWKVSRQTNCDNLKLGGITCPPDPRGSAAP